MLRKVGKCCQHVVKWVMVCRSSAGNSDRMGLCVSGLTNSQGMWLINRGCEGVERRAFHSPPSCSEVLLLKSHCVEAQVDGTC